MHGEEFFLRSDCVDPKVLRSRSMGLVYRTFARYNTSLLYLSPHQEMFSQYGTCYP